MYNNVDYIYDVIVQPQQIADVAAEVENNSNDYDAVATIDNTKLVVISKSEIRSSNKGIVLNEIDNLKKKNTEIHFCHCPVYRQGIKKKAIFA